MSKKTPNRAIHQRDYKLTGLFIFLIIASIIFLLTVYKNINKNRHIPSHNSTIHNRASRGSIISADNYILSHSEKTYEASIRGASIAPQKREIFIKLFSIYSGIDEKKIHKELVDKNGQYKKGYIALSRDISSKYAMQLKTLSRKLMDLDVFQSIKTRSGAEMLYGLDIIENGEKRKFPLKDVFSPTLGYVGKDTEKGYIRPKGKKGLERNYEKYIHSKRDGYFQGKRDVNSRIIHDKNSIKLLRTNGLDLHLNIVLSIQRRIELMLDAMKTKLNADEIIVGVMESHTGKVLSLASSERYDPSNITQKDIPALNPKFSEYPYEAGSVIKPLTISIALDNNLVTPDTWFDTFNGTLKIGKRHRISDDEKFESLTVEDIIVHSSNVGCSQISWRLSGQEFRDGLLKFGVAKPSGIDLSRDLPGMLKKVYKLNHKLHRASTSYGYGMQITFAQLFKAYSAFNNDGIAVTPRLVDYLKDAKGRQYTLTPKAGDIRAISKKSANEMHEILKEVVQRGTGVKAQYPGLEIGGKTGTAHIVKNRRYVREYHSSFYGFANDKHGNKYTIGVLVIRAKKRYKYFASQSAVPTFKNIVRILVKQDKLIPETIEEKIDIVDMYKTEVSKPLQVDVTNKKEIKAIKKPKKIRKSFKEPQIPTTKPSPQQIQQFENIEDLF